MNSPSRVSLLLTCLVCVALAGAALAKDTDSNAQGFKAYEKGDYKKAHALFEKALKQNPSNAYARRKHFFFEVHLVPAGGEAPQLSWPGGTVKVGPLGMNCE